ncbi:hypothetical protein H1C71_037735, partial [Ictidomys tridecemlineatus]
MLALWLPHAGKTNLMHSCLSTMGPAGCAAFPGLRSPCLHLVTWLLHLGLWGTVLELLASSTEDLVNGLTGPIIHQGESPLQNPHCTLGPERHEMPLAVIPEGWPAPWPLEPSEALGG